MLFRSVGQAAKASRCERGLADFEHTAGVAMPAVLDDRDIDIDDIAFLQWFVVGNSVADLVVD